MINISLFFKSCINKSQNYLLVWSYIFGRMEKESSHCSINEISTRFKISQKTIYLILNYGVAWFNKSDFEYCFYVKNKYLYSITRENFDSTIFLKKEKTIKLKETDKKRVRNKVIKAVIQSTEYDNDIELIISFLNFKTKKTFYGTDPLVKEVIMDRLKEGFTIDDFNKIIEFKTKQWQKSFNEQHLTPTTLFGFNMEKYLTESNTSVIPNKKSSTQLTYETTNKAKSILKDRRKNQSDTNSSKQ